MHERKSDNGEGHSDVWSGRQPREVCPVSGTNGMKSWEERTWKQVNSQRQELKREKFKRSVAAQ